MTIRQLLALARRKGVVACYRHRGDMQSISLRTPGHEWEIVGRRLPEMIAQAQMAVESIVCMCLAALGGDG